MYVNDQVKSAIMALVDANGGVIQPEQLVEAARHREHPAHDCFIWNDKDAAVAHRIATARVLIRSVRLVVETVELTAPKRVPAFSHNAGGSGYATLDHLRRDPDRAREAAIMEFGRAATALRRARAIGIELGLGKEVDATLAQLLAGLVSVERMYAGRA